MEQETSQKMTALDSLVQDRQLQMLKAALPYINSSAQRTIAFLVKFMELEHTISLFHSPQNSLQICAVSENEEASSLQMLEELREFCTEKERENIDLFINYMQIFSVYKTLFH